MKLGFNPALTITLPCEWSADHHTVSVSVRLRVSGRWTGTQGSWTVESRSILPGSGHQSQHQHSCWVGIESEWMRLGQRFMHESCVPAVIHPSLSFPLTHQHSRMSDWWWSGEWWGWKCEAVSIHAPAFTLHPGKALLIPFPSWIHDWDCRKRSVHNHDPFTPSQSSRCHCCYNSYPVNESASHEKIEGAGVSIHHSFSIRPAFVNEWFRNDGGMAVIHSFHSLPSVS